MELKDWLDIVDLVPEYKSATRTDKEKLAALLQKIWCDGRYQGIRDIMHVQQELTTKRE